MNPQITKLIEMQDGHLGQLRKLWMNAPHSDKPSWMEKINAALDQRAATMQLRDLQPQLLGLA